MMRLSESRRQRRESQHGSGPVLRRPRLRRHQARTGACAGRGAGRGGAGWGGAGRWLLQECYLQILFSHALMRRAVLHGTAVQCVCDSEGLARTTRALAPRARIHAPASGPGRFCRREHNIQLRASGRDGPHGDGLHPWAEVLLDALSRASVHDAVCKSRSCRRRFRRRSLEQSAGPR